MEKDKISVIVPVYNVEKYLNRNIESLLKQKCSDFEIIYVDDGSTDNCLNILKKYKSKDKRIKVVHTDNFGVSHARNTGMNHATGRYITFVDGDDYVDDDYLDYLLSLVKNDNLKMGISLKHHINDDMIQDNNILRDIKDSYEIIQNIYMNHIFMAVWNKIYDRSFLKEHNIKFDESIWYAEGMHFNVQCLSSTDKVAVGNKKVYHYISNPNSAMRKGFKIKNEKCALKSLDLQREILKNKGIKKCYELEYHYMLVEYMIYSGIIANNLEKKYEIEMKNSIKEIRKRILIPLRVDLSFKEKITWLCIGMIPGYMAKKHLKKDK